MKNTNSISKIALGLLFAFIFSNNAFAQTKTSTEAYEISNEALKEYVGQYDPEGGQFFSITVSLDGDDKLKAQPTDKRQPLSLLTALSKDKFIMRGPGITFTFTRNDKDEIVSLEFAQGGRSFMTKKKVE